MRKNKQKTATSAKRGRQMAKENDNIYFLTRKNLGLTREKAVELFDTISVDRLERIENEKAIPNPSEVKEMAKKYKAIQLCNYYCTHQCEIGQEFIDEIKMKDLSQIVLETLASLNSISQKKDRLIEISVDGKITGDEIKDFIQIKKELERISMTVDSLKLWTEQMKSNGMIDQDEYDRIEGQG